jgi:hypothetical protein
MCFDQVDAGHSAMKVAGRSPRGPIFDYRRFRAALVDPRFFGRFIRGLLGSCRTGSSKPGKSKSNNCLIFVFSSGGTLVR